MNCDWEFPTLVEIALYYVPENTKAGISELDEKLKSRKLCKKCGKLSHPRKNIIDAYTRFGKIPIRANRCWKCSQGKNS